MTAITEHNGGRGWNPWRVAGWSAAAVVLVLPLVAMQFTDEVNWSLNDFAVAAAMLVCVGIGFELAVRKSANRNYRIAVAVALATAFILVWASGAVGIVGHENNSANLLFAGVVAVGIVGAVIARFKPSGMARALIATAVAQVVVAAIAMAFYSGATAPALPRDLLIATAFFTMLWLVSAWMFGKSAK